MIWGLAVGRRKCIPGDTKMLSFQAMEFSEPRWYKKRAIKHFTGPKYLNKNSTQRCKYLNVLFK